MKKAYGGVTGRKPADEAVRSKHHGKSQTSYGKSIFIIVNLHARTQSRSQRENRGEEGKGTLLMIGEMISVL